MGLKNYVGLDKVCSSITEQHLHRTPASHVTVQGDDTIDDAIIEEGDEHRISGIRNPVTAARHIFF